MLLHNKAVMSERYVKRALVSVAGTTRLRASFHPKHAFVREIQQLAKKSTGKVSGVRWGMLYEAGS